MFIVNWLFDKLGYIPKVSIRATWPFPVTSDEQIVKKATTRKPRPTAKVVAKTARTKKAK